MPDPNHASEPKRPSGTKTWLKWLTRWLVFPFLGALIGSVVIGRIVSAIMQPESYRVYIVGNFQEEVNIRIREAFFANLNQLGTLDDVKVVVDPTQNDYGDPERARSIAERLIAAGDTLMVVGHLASTQTRAVLPAYLQQTDPPVPVILTTETNPNLLPPAENQLSFPVLRLSPADSEQARVAACLAVAQNAQSIAVIEAGENPVYSKYLAREFVERVHGMHRGKVLVWSENLGDPFLSALQSFNLDSVYLAGDWRSALVLANQLRSLTRPGRAVKLILSDACMDPRLLTLGGADLENSYLTFALSSERFQSERGFGAFGSDARELVKMLLARTDTSFDKYASEGRGFRRFMCKLLGLRRVGDARNAIDNCIRQLKGSHDTFAIGNRQLEADEDGFLVSPSRGNGPSQGGFFVWQIQKSGDGYVFKDFPMSPCPR